VRQALRVLLDSVIDYAGTHQPASLPLPEALANYVRFRKGAESWIVNRFVCSASKLSELADEIERQKPVVVFPVAVIGQAASDIASFRLALDQDSASMERFQDAVGQGALLETYEVRLPANSNFERVVADLQAFDSVEVFLELQWGDGLEEAMAAAAEIGWLSVKARTGGPSSSAYPSAVELAVFVQQALDLDLRLKLTAGLHHALPNVDAATAGRAHGFLNVFVAAALHEAHGLSRVEIEAVLGEREIDQFSFSESDVGWRELSAGLESIEDMRSLFAGFGSCSIAEPLEDIEALGLLRRVGV